MFFSHLKFTIVLMAAPYLQCIVLLLCRPGPPSRQAAPYDTREVLLQLLCTCVYLLTGARYFHRRFHRYFHVSATWLRMLRNKFCQPWLRMLRNILSRAGRCYVTSSAKVGKICYVTSSAKGAGRWTGTDFCYVSRPAPLAEGKP
jgi:hypothetical protein